MIHILELTLDLCSSPLAILNTLPLLLTSRHGQIKPSNSPATESSPSSAIATHSAHDFDSTPKETLLHSSGVQQSKTKVRSTGRSKSWKQQLTINRVTSLFVSVPILLVTSYMLYNRLVLGEEQKKVGVDPLEKKVGLEGIIVGKAEAVKERIQREK